MAQKKGKSASGYTEDWLPVRGIQNNMIITRDNYKVTGVKITPRNIFILDRTTQENILLALRNFYNTIDYEFWLVVADRPVDISVYMSQMQLLLNETQSPAVRKVIMQDIKKDGIQKIVVISSTIIYCSFINVWHNKRDRTT